MNYNELIDALNKLYYDAGEGIGYQLIPNLYYDGSLTFSDLRSSVIAHIPNPKYGNYGYGAVYNQILRQLKINRPRDFIEAKYI